jgi:competence protein ComEC
MQKKYLLLFAGFLLALNIFCWKEIFVLAEPQKLKVDFLDVGQGDSELITTPQQHHILIDGGPDSMVLGKLSQRMPFWNKNLDLVILTHPEKDHMQGLLDVLKIYKANYILWTGVAKTAPEYSAWLEVLNKQKKMGSKILIAKSEQEIIAVDVKFDTLCPFKSLEGQEMKNTSNDSCVVSHLIYKNNSFLFTGDLSDKGEKQLVQNKSDLASDVLKVGHHGSKTSTSELFLEAIQPKIAVISVGAKNTYGHPTLEVLQRLADFGVKTLRTDQNGDITIVSNGENIQINN